MAFSSIAFQRGAFQLNAFQIGPDTTHFGDRITGGTFRKKRWYEIKAEQEKERLAAERALEAKRRRIEEERQRQIAEAKAAKEAARLAQDVNWALARKERGEQAALATQQGLQRMNAIMLDASRQGMAARQVRQQMQQDQEEEAMLERWLLGMQ